MSVMKSWLAEHQGTAEQATEVYQNFEAGTRELEVDTSTGDISWKAKTGNPVAPGDRVLTWEEEKEFELWWDKTFKETTENHYARLNEQLAEEVMKAVPSKTLAEIWARGDYEIFDKISEVKRLHGINMLPSNIQEVKAIPNNFQTGQQLLEIGEVSDLQVVDATLNESTGMWEVTTGGSIGMASAMEVCGALLLCTGVGVLEHIAQEQLTIKALQALYPNDNITTENYQQYMIPVVNYVGDTDLTPTSTGTWAMGTYLAKECAEFIINSWIDEGVYETSDYEHEEIAPRPESLPEYINVNTASLNTNAIDGAIYDLFNLLPQKLYQTEEITRTPGGKDVHIGRDEMLAITASLHLEAFKRALNDNHLLLSDFNYMEVAVGAYVSKPTSTSGTAYNMTGLPSLSARLIKLKDSVQATRNGYTFEIPVSNVETIFTYGQNLYRYNTGSGDTKYKYFGASRPMIHILHEEDFPPSTRSIIINSTKGILNPVQITLDGQSEYSGRYELFNDTIYDKYTQIGGYENVEIVGTVPTSPSIDLSFPEWNNVHKKFTGLAKTIVGAGATITPLEWTGVPINPLTLADDTRVINPTDYDQSVEWQAGHAIGGNTEPDAQKKLYWMPWGKYDYASKVEPWVDPSPSPTPTPDPQPQPQPQPTPVVPPPVTKTDTLDPTNPTPPDPMKGKDIVFPVVPTITTNSKLFTVYNPSNGQLGDLGNYIWNAFTQTIVSLFQNPLDGIISLQQIWGNPIVGASKNIYLGNLNSEVSAPVVVKRYDDIDMGSIAIPEYYKNALDYDATSIQIYLPFIGYRELDIRDVMASIIHLKYTIDYYTGCCLAHLSVYRNSIEVNFYEFEGCCSTSIPLTSADCSRLLTGITSAVVGAATIGPYGAVMGLSHMGSNVGRSGSFSRDAGVMGGKKPFVIISRMRSYDAGSYEKFYGYPANKTVKIGSLSGYVRVKDVHLDNFVATDTEKAEIERLLKQGVIV